MSEAPRHSLRQDFARWMQTDLGYAETQTGVHIHGVANERAEIVDVRGAKWSASARRLRSAALWLLGVTFVAENVPALRDAVPFAPKVSFGVMIALFVAAYATKQRTRQYTWVSCTDKAKPLGSSDIQRLRNAVDAYRRRSPAGWIPAETILVSSTSGFEPSAVERAKVLRVQCYRRTDTGFERVA